MAKFVAAAMVVTAADVLGSASRHTPWRSVGVARRLFVDALLAEPLGLNGAIFAALTYLLLRFRERILMYGLVQQAILVFVFVATAQTVRSLCLNFFNNQDWNLLPLTTSLVSAVLWPYVYKLLRALEPKAGLR
ncbi:MAG: hypothetical protein CM15mP68_3380 [Pseudomonadota bacterium]|nr:MAG: hypothetical protein CM15mP68_3380 [Pseudomonadota bacterium]